MLQSLLIANRGEIARRIIRTARRMGIRTVAVFTEADRSWPHWSEADDSVLIGDGPVRESYLSIERILAAAQESGAAAIHPGYGFLSENAAFADACEAAGLVFVGPPAAAIRAMGSKAVAKSIMTRAGVPVAPGYGGERQDSDFLRQKAYELGYPILVKAVAGGGGRGMRRVDRALDFDAALASAKREALSAFGDDRVLIEKYIERPRHIEVQVFGDSHGNVVHLFERDCSVQRRHQKLIEEAPAPGLSEELRAAVGAAAVKAAAAVEYRGAGTVEFVADTSNGLLADKVYFIEMNTRLQVEHPVTEAVTGLDLVEWQLRVAAGEPLPLRQDEIRLRGHAIEARLYAEDPVDGFRPTAGRLWRAAFPESAAGIRIDSGVEEGTVVGAYYDGLLAKIVATGPHRVEALARLDAALAQTRIAGPKTNLAFLSGIVSHPYFRAGAADTGFIDRDLERLLGPSQQADAANGAVGEWARREAERHAASAAGAWARTDAFELGGLQRTSLMPVELDGERSMADATQAMGEVRHADANSGRDTEVVWAGREAFVLARGRQIHVAFPDPLARDLHAVEASGQITAPMPGRIVDVAVTQDRRVSKGDPLFTLEAMKMEHAVTSPVTGTVRDVRVAPGQQVERGAIAVVIEADEPGTR
jgi:3-methylcrotonyl-CoA carboxylase alpha subunit